MSIQQYGGSWPVYDPASALVCVTIYQRGVIEVLRRLSRVPA